MAEEKLDLAKKIYNYSELNLSKIHSKIKELHKQMEEDAVSHDNEYSSRRDDIYETQIKSGRGFYGRST